LGALVGGLGELSLGESLDTLVGQAIVVINTVVVRGEGHLLGAQLGAGRGEEGVARVKLLAKLNTAGPGSKVGRVTVLSQRPQAQSTAGGAQRGLEPLFVVRVGARELLEAGPDVNVEGLQGSSVEAGGHNPGRKDQLAEARAVAEQLQGNLRVRKLPQGLQNLGGLADPCPRVLVAELAAPDGPTKELEVAIPNDLKVSRETANVNRGGRPTNKNKLALVFGGSSACAELEPYPAAPAPERVERLGNGIPIAGQA